MRSSHAARADSKPWAAVGPDVSRELKALRAKHVQIEEMRRRYADLYESAPIAYLVLDCTGRIAEANGAAVELLRSDGEHLLGQPLATFASPAQQREVQAHVVTCVREKVRASLELTIAASVGAPRHVQVISSPVLDSQGRVVSCRTALVDVSSRKRTEEVLTFLAEASTLLSSSFDCTKNLGELVRRSVPLIADACVADVLDGAGRLSRVEIAVADRRLDCVAAADILLPPRAEPSTVLGAVLKLRKPVLIPAFQALDSDRGPAGLEHDRFVRACAPRSAMYLPIVAGDRIFGALTLVTSKSGRHFGGLELEIAQDLVRRVAIMFEASRLYREADEAVRRRERVLSVVSHDLKNPLVAILLSVDELLRRTPTPERRRGWAQLERIRRGARHMGRMLDDLLDLASIDADRLALKMTAQDLESILDDVVELYRPLSTNKAIEIRVSLSDDARCIRCDRDRITQVLYNLLGNALKFTPRGGRVVVAATSSGSEVTVSVLDTGPGIAAEVVPRLFDRFTQGSQTVGRGRGLGLFISKAIVQAHGGTVWVEPGDEGGARFCFTVPRQGARTSQRSRTATKSPDGGRMHRSSIAD